MTTEEDLAHRRAVAGEEEEEEDHTAGVAPCRHDNKPSALFCPPPAPPLLATTPPQPPLPPLLPAAAPLLRAARPERALLRLTVCMRAFVAEEAALCAITRPSPPDAPLNVTPSNQQNGENKGGVTESLCQSSVYI